jgi:DNA-binding NarL/FixJ family response regulator
VAELLERERELAELEDAIGEALAGRGGALAIEASAGLGKTRLLREARATGLSRVLNVLSARATELERDFPFALVRQLFGAQLAALSPQDRDSVLEGAGAARGALGLDAGDDRATDSFAVLHGLYWVTAALADRTPLLLAVDDTHLADAGSLEYLGFLLPRLEELPVFLLIAARSDAPDASEKLRQILTDTGVRNLTLGPLSTEATATLLAQELDTVPEATFAATCHEVSGGNPFLLCELARTLIEQGIEPTAHQAESVRNLAPERVAQTALMRLARLSPDASSIGRSLAVLGDDADLRLVAELAGIEIEAARHAADELRASAIFDDGTSLRFIHPLVRNALYADIPAGERGEAHARAAQLLRERGASPERIATQLLASEAREDRTTVENLVEAGERALATGAPRSAIAYLNRALHEPAPADLRPAVLEPLLTAGFRAADHAVLPAIEAELQAEMDRDPSLRSRWAIQLTMSMALSGRFAEAATMLRDAVDVVVADGDVERAFQLEAQLNTLAQVVPSVPKVNLDRYANQIDPDSPGGRLVAAMEVRARATSLSSARETAEAAKRALGDNGTIFAEDTDLISGPISVMTLVAADEMDAAEQAAKRALEIARERNAAPDLCRGWFLSGFVAWGYGDLIHAEADIRQSVDLARLAGIPPLVLMYMGSLTEILIERDELDAAETELRAVGAASGPLPENPISGIHLLTRGHLRFEQGRLEEAVEDFATLADYAEKMGLGAGAPASASPFAARALVALGRRAEARTLADEMMVWAESWGAPSSVAHVLRAVAAARGGEEGIQLLERAVATIEDSPRQLERAHAFVELGEALRRANRRVESRAPLREAFRLARRCGAARIARRAQAELEASGESVRRYAPIGVESLTPSERRVAELAAGGLTNRQIAQSLFVTVKTVEAHLSAAYDKLDIESRRQLPEALAVSSSPCSSYER